MAEEQKENKGGLVAGIVVVVIAIVGAVGYLIHHLTTGQM
jgi:hypothetical protein